MVQKDRERKKKTWSRFSRNLREPSRTQIFRLKSGEVKNQSSQTHSRKRSGLVFGHLCHLNQILQCNVIRFSSSAAYLC
jgi:hypothetical protein